MEAPRRFSVPTKYLSCGRLFGGIDHCGTFYSGGYGIKTVSDVAFVLFIDVAYDVMIRPYS